MLSPIAAPRSAASFAPAEARTRTGNWKTWGLGLLVAAIIGGVCQAAPVTLYDSTTNTASYADTADSLNWFGNQFKTDGVAYSLNDVVLDLAAVPSTGTVEVDIYGDSGSSPSGLIGALTTPGTMQVGLNTFSATSLSLPANASFWVVLRGLNGGSADWNLYDGVTPIVTGPGASTYSIASDNSGQSWYAATADLPFLMQVHATPASNVPEIDPSGVGSVMALVTSALGLLERRRSRKA